MLSLEQIKLLEKKVEKAISIIKALNGEKEALRLKIIEKDKRIAELENLLVNFKDDQAKIESSIKNTLTLLNSLEDLAVSSSSSTGAEQKILTASVDANEVKQKTASQSELDEILGKPKALTQADVQADIF